MLINTFSTLRTGKYLLYCRITILAISLDAQCYKGIMIKVTGQIKHVSP